MTDDTAGIAAVGTSEETVDTNETVEAKAREKGWRPETEWKGSTKNWKDASTFLEHMEREDRITKLEDRLSRVGKTTEKALENLKRAHEKELANLKAEKRAAVAKGDVNAVEKLDEAIDTLKDAKPEKTEGDSAGEDKFEVIADWQLDNPWYASDKAMSDYAITISEGYKENHPGASMKENLAHVDKKVRAKFPDYDFGSKKPAAATKPAGANGHAPVDGGGAFPGLSKKTGKTASDLPQEARDVGMLLVKDPTSSFKDLNDYAKAYFAEEK